MIFHTAQGQQLVGVGYIHQAPERLRHTWQMHFWAHVIPPLPMGLRALASKPVVQQLLMQLEILHKRIGLLRGLGVRQLHPLQPLDDRVYFTIKQPGQGGLVPWLLPLRMRPIRQ